jgi:hypothetical protein
MLIYLDNAYRARVARAAQEGRTTDIKCGVMHGAVERVRPEADNRRRHHGGPLADHVGCRRGIRDRQIWGDTRRSAAT